MSEFDRSELYEKHVKEHVKKALLACDFHHIPAFLTFAVANDKDGTTYVTEMLSAAAEGEVLKDDKLVKHALVVDGFTVVPKITIPSFEEEMEVVEDE